MTTRGRVHDVVHRHTVAMDTLLALVVLGGFVMAARKDDPNYWSGDQQTAPVLLLEGLIFLALVLRRTYPMLVLGVTLLGATVVCGLVNDGVPVAAPVAAPAILAVHTIAARSDRRTTLWVTAFAGATLLVGGTMLGSYGWFSSVSISMLAWTGFAAALGQAIRSQKAYVAAVVERARRAEQSRDEEAGRRVIEERLRIARELHDVVAHHIAVIQVQAGVVDHLMVERPEAARDALGHVRRASRMVLDELSGMLDVLRQPDDPITPTDPAPGLDRVVALVDSFAASGLRVDWRITGTPAPLPAAVDLVAYRLVQEGLTNAHKHGTGTAELVIAFEPDALMIDVVNRVQARVGAGGGAGPAATAGPGHGLAGMRERAYAVGGTVSAAPQGDGSWRVTARVPLEQASVIPSCLRRSPTQ
jgi:signal transduction histidine kinase